MISPSTLESFLPENCQFDDAGNPIVTMAELQRNVGSFLAKQFDTHYQEQEGQLINSLGVRLLQKDLNQAIQ